MTTNAPAPDAYPDESILWNAAPADEWKSAFPIGSGKLGAMVFGGIEEERIALNHEGLWRGMTRNREQPDVADRLPEIRELFFAGDLAAGASLAEEVLGGHGRRIMPYQPVGNLRIRTVQHDGAPITGYRRELDLRTGIAATSYLAGNVDIRRESIATAEHDVIATRITASEPLAFDIRLDRQTLDADPVASRNERFDGDDSEVTTSRHASLLSLVGRFPEGIDFAAAAHVVADDNASFASGEDESVLRVENATDVTIVIAMAVRVEGGDAPDSLQACRTHLGDTPIDWTTLREAHIAEHRELYDRVSLRLATPDDCGVLPLAERMRRLREGGADHGLAVLYFNFGRYLLIGSSRRCDLPANLQGIWNEHLSPAWQSDFHLNINLQMNYWPAEVCNLPETVEPFVRFLERSRPSAEQSARNLYGCRGIFMPHATDAWGRATPEAPVCDVWQGAAAWLAQHLWWHWEYGGDRDFLAEHAYPYIRAAAIFWQDVLVPERRDGHPLAGRLVSVPSNSPENAYAWNGHKLRYGIGATMDLLLAHEVLFNAITAAAELDVDDDLRRSWQATLDNLAPLQVGRHGQLQEYLDDFDEPEPGHRHVSHLYGVFPGDSITEDSDSELFAAARVSLERRLAHGGGHTGWSRAWTAALWARFGEGDLAAQHLDALITDFATDAMLDLHPPRIFQIDGNFGGTAAIAEMLLQSHGGILRILPALPTAWQEGSVTGLCARGGHLVDIVWRVGEVAACTVTAGHAGTLQIRLPGDGPWERFLADSGTQAGQVADSGHNAVYSGSTVFITVRQVAERWTIRPATRAP